VAIAYIFSNFDESDKRRCLTSEKQQLNSSQVSKTNLSTQSN
jgi:hypothetical protein